MLKKSFLRENCLNEYGIVKKLGEGVFSNVFKVVKKATNEFFTLKLMKKKFSSYDLVYSLPEVKYSESIKPNNNVISVDEIIYEPQIGRLSILYDFVETDLFTLIQEGIDKDDIICYSKQLLNGINYLHSLNLIHRDLKPENLFINKDTKELRIGDLGSIEEAPCSYIPGVYITTRWYRSPEILLKAPQYSKESDVWAAGCIIAEMIIGRPLFTGRDTKGQLMKIHNALGQPSDEIFEDIGADQRYKAFQFNEIEFFPLEEILKESGCCNLEMIDLVMQMLEYVPEDRISADEALKHPAFMKYN